MIKKPTDFNSIAESFKFMQDPKNQMLVSGSEYYGILYLLEQFEDFRMKSAIDFYSAIGHNAPKVLAYELKHIQEMTSDILKRFVILENIPEPNPPRKRKKRGKK